MQTDLSAEPDVRFVSITVDPEQDTPEVLAEYAARFGAARDRWLFLTGEKKIIYALASKGFRLGVVDPGEPAAPPAAKEVSRARSRAELKQHTQRWERDRPPLAQRLADTVESLLAAAPALAHPGHPGKPFMHSSRFILVDQQARVRGYYDSQDEGALQRLRQDVKALLRGNAR